MMTDILTKVFGLLVLFGILVAGSEGPHWPWINIAGCAASALAAAVVCFLDSRDNARPAPRRD